MDQMAPQPAEPVRRTFEIEEPTNLYVIHPIAAWLTRRFAALGVPPNAVSLTGMACGILAGLAYSQYRDGWCAFIGFLLMIAWHVMDGADGQLARLTNAQSELGKVLDGICDYVTFIAVYTGLGVTLALQHGVWVLVVVLLAGLCHAVQSAAYEAQRQAYDFWGRGRGAPPPAPGALPPPAGFTGRLYRAYVWLQLTIAGGAPEFAARMTAALTAKPERADELRLRYRAAFAPAVRRWSVLSANYRTLGIFACAVLQVPMYYFWFEIFGFSLILAILLAGQRTRIRQFMQALPAA